jgi:hypothetical protein
MQKSSGTSFSAGFGRWSNSTKQQAAGYLLGQRVVQVVDWLWQYAFDQLATSIWARAVSGA